MDDLPADRLPDLGAHLGYWLRLASNHVSADFARALQTRQVSIAEWVALRCLYDRNEITPGELAERLGTTRGAVSKILDKLEAKAWVTSRTKAEDRRVQSLSLTPQGTQILPALVEIAESNEKKYFDCFDRQEQEQLANLLQKLARIHQWTDVPTD